MLNSTSADATQWPKKEFIQSACAYIDKYWSNLKRQHKISNDTLLGLPHTYMVPADQRGDFRFNEQYYWDSYFVSLGLVVSKHNLMAENMLENLFFMFKKLKLIPNASRFYMTSRSQPPMLTSYILLIYESNKKDKQWLKTAIDVAHQEYLTVWMGKSHPNWREVHSGLSRYYDTNVLHDLAEMESGWDMTPRFSRRALDFLPIDLNCLLYKYEIDFAQIADILGDPHQAKKWRNLAEIRRQNVNRLMWNKLKHFYFDYNYVESRQANIWSLAAYYALWSGLADKEQARWLVKHIHKFGCKGGLSTTSKTFVNLNIFGSIKTQWAYPNGWAPLHYMVVEGLNNYGYQLEAEIIAKKWLTTCTDWFEHHNQFLEKYNVSSPKRMPHSGVYPTQVGFGWTNSIYLYLVKKYNLNQNSVGDG